MRNRYAGRCNDGCGTWVAEGAGYFHRMPRGSAQKWVVRCIPCVAKAKQARGDSLSYAQQEALRSQP